MTENPPDYALNRLIVDVAEHVRRNAVAAPATERVMVFTNAPFDSFDRPGWAEVAFEVRSDYSDDPTGAPDGTFEDPLEAHLMFAVRELLDGRESDPEVYIAAYSKCQPKENGAMSMAAFIEEVRAGLDWGEDGEDPDDTALVRLVLPLPWGLGVTAEAVPVPA